MTEIFLMTLVLPMFGIFGSVLNSLVASWAGKQLFQKKGVPPAPVGGILPTVAMLFAQRAKANQVANQGATNQTPADQTAVAQGQRDTGQVSQQGDGTTDPMVRQALENASFLQTESHPRRRGVLGLAFGLFGNQLRQPSAFRRAEILRALLRNMPPR